MGRLTFSIFFNNLAKYFNFILKKFQKNQNQTRKIPIEIIPKSEINVDLEVIKDRETKIPLIGKLEQENKY